MISLPFRCRLQLIPLVALLLCAISPGLEGATVLVSGSSLVRTVAITFDDGPHDILTPTLLDVLDTLGVKASFFLVGSMAEKKA
jgi:peptidoglycan/xylan/chitin deacetylase (PgdA/CDA1 family)